MSLEQRKSTCLDDQGSKTPHQSTNHFSPKAIPGLHTQIESQCIFCLFVCHQQTCIYKVVVKTAAFGLSDILYLERE